jgi:hypothetical protein
LAEIKNHKPEKDKKRDKKRTKDKKRRVIVEK